MMKSLKLILLIGMGVLYPFLNSNAQSYDELTQLFSNTLPGGTARVMGMAGVQSSLGGDVSLANSNPAGLGMANRSSFTFSGNIGNLNTSTLYYGVQTPDSKLNVNIPQLGLIFHKSPNREDSDFKGGALAINYSRINSFQNRASFSGVPDNSLIDYYLYNVDGRDPYIFQAGDEEYNTITELGWNTFLIDTLRDENSNLFFSSLVLDYPIKQGEIQEIKGAQYNWNFAYGGNYKDMVFFGFGFNISRVRYNSTKTFYEDYDINSPDYTVKSFTLKETLNVNGSGINANLGVTVRPVDVFQVSLAYTTPTVYNITDQWRATMNVDWDGFYYAPQDSYLDSWTEETDLIFSDYTMVTPSRVTLGSTMFFGKHGFISADFEQIDYSKSRLNSRLFSMDVDNSLISEKYTKANNIRVGGEFRHDMFRVRGGYGIRTSPNSGDILDDNSVKTLAAGFGIYKESNFIDFALTKSTYHSSYFPYLINGEGAEALSKHNRVNVMATFGWVF